MGFIDGRIKIYDLSQKRYLLEIEGLEGEKQDIEICHINFVVSTFGSVCITFKSGCVKAFLVKQVDGNFTRHTDRIETLRPGGIQYVRRFPKYLIGNQMLFLGL